MRGSPTNALDYFREGLGLIIQPQYRPFILVPLLVNAAIFVGLTVAFFYAFQDFFTTIMAWTPDWLDWLSWLLWPLIGFIFFVVYGYSFNLITNFIAAPFFGLLAEKIETQLGGVSPPEQSLSELIPRTLGRECTKLWYFLTRGLLVLLVVVGLFFVPGANILGAVIGALWSCWCMSVQYLDYPADNHQLSFRVLRQRLNQVPLTSYSFGGIILAGSMVPVLNIFVPPIAVAGATIYWMREISSIKVN